MLMKLKGALIALSMFMVVGTFLSKSAHAECKEGEERTTTTGAVFTCDTSHPALGEAWRDPDGLIWGDIVKKTDERTVHYRDYNEATSYCASIGAHLPSKKEFTWLREYMGARPGTWVDYSPQVLPNLSSYWFWSSSVEPGYGDYAYGFDGSYGRIGDDIRDRNNAFRCVVGR